MDGARVIVRGPIFKWARPRPLEVVDGVPVYTAGPYYDEYVLAYSSLSNGWVYLLKELMEHHLKRGRIT
jgi:hypothetical protein